MRYFVCSTISLLELLINPSAYNVGGITHYFSRCKSNDHLMHWGIKIRAWRAWIFNTQMDSFLQKVRMIFQQFSKFALSSKLKHLYLGWLWQQPLLFEKIDKFWDCGFLIGYLETALHSFDLWILIPAHLYGPGHCWESVTGLTYLARMFCSRPRLWPGRCPPSPPAAWDSCRSRSRSLRSRGCCAETSWRRWCQ